MATKREKACSMTETYETITYAQPLPGVAQITLDRPNMRNAQDLQNDL